MARVNYATLHGQVTGDPRLTINNDGEIKTAMFSMRVMRRPTTVNEYIGANIFIDCPVIYTKNTEMALKIQDLHTGDMVDVTGVITTREVKKSGHCPECSEKNVVEGNIVFVTPIYICKRENVSDSEGLELLKARSEVSNRISVIGNLCREPQYYQDGNGKHYAQYQLAVQRRYRIREEQDEIKVDYPWVKTFGKQALQDAQSLRLGSTVYIDGALQTRKIERTSICAFCGAEYRWEDNAIEIVPYYTGYIKNCMEPETETEVANE